MRAMFNGLHDLDWSAMRHPDGSAEDVPGLLVALRSADSHERDRALSRLHRAVHDEGDVHPCTTASLPFLFALATDPATPDRAAIVALLVSIGRRAGLADSADHTAAADAVRSRAETFAVLAADPDAAVRRAAVPGLGLFLDNAQRAAGLLRERLRAATGVTERILTMEATATLALRLPAAADDILMWFGRVAADPAADPETRLAAVIQRARCTPGRISDDLVPAVISLLWTITSLTPPSAAGRSSSGPLSSAGESSSGPPSSASRSPSGSPARGASPDGAGRAPSTAPGAADLGAEVVAALAGPERIPRVHAPSGGLLWCLHDMLGGRVAERAAVLAEQLRSPDAGWRLDAIRMSGDLMTRWRGDHSDLIRLLARQAVDDDLEVAAAAAALLATCHPIASPVRETLAARVVAFRPEAWADPRPAVRRAHRETVTALARLGDERAVPSLCTALTTDVDAWRAVEAARHLPGSSGPLAPLIAERLDRAGHTRDRDETSIRAMLDTLSALADPSTVPAVVGALRAAVRHHRADTVTAALTALAAFGPAAEPGLPDIRSLVAGTATEFAGPPVAPAALAALWSVGGDAGEVMPGLLRMLDDDAAAVRAAAEVLGEIGPPAVAAAPRLRDLVTGGREQVRAHCAAALREIGGEPETPAVLEALLSAWRRDAGAAQRVVACLRRMGPAAAPALPDLLAELAQSRRGDGRITDIAADERLQRACRDVIVRLGH